MATKNPIFIVTSHFKEDLSWLARQDDFDYVVYSKKPSGLIGLSIDESRIRSVENRGREALVYFKFMIDFYTDLPERIAFCHGHEMAWHQDVNILEAIQGYDGSDYFSLNKLYLRHSFYDDCPYGHSMWLKLKSYTPIFGIDLPDKLEHTMGAQFITTRARVLSNKVELYQRCYDWLNEQREMADFRAAIIFEQMWYFILTGKTVEPRRLDKTILSERGYEE